MEVSHALKLLPLQRELNALAAVDSWIQSNKTIYENDQSSVLNHLTSLIWVLVSHAPAVKQNITQMILLPCIQTKDKVESMIGTDNNIYNVLKDFKIFN